MKKPRSREDVTYFLALIATAAGVLSCLWALLVGHSLLDLKPWKAWVRSAKLPLSVRPSPLSQSPNPTSHTYHQLPAAGVPSGFNATNKISHVSISTHRHPSALVRGPAPRRLHVHLARFNQKLTPTWFKQRKSIAQRAPVKKYPVLRLATTPYEHSHRYYHVARHWSVRMTPEEVYYVIPPDPDLPCVSETEAPEAPSHTWHREYTSPVILGADGSQRQYHREETVTKTVTTN